MHKIVEWNRMLQIYVDIHLQAEYDNNAMDTSFVEIRTKYSFFFEWNEF